MCPGLHLALSTRQPPAANTMRSLFQGVFANNFPDDEWRRYVTCNDLRWTTELKHCGDYWDQIGIDLFPKIAVAASVLIWIPPVVTDCDSMLSIIDYKFSDRQCSLHTTTASTIMSMRVNNKIEKRDDE
eukprot:PhM_4_TR9962/c0_g1_i1/m.75541